MNWKFYIFLCHLLVLVLASSVLSDLAFLKPPSVDANHHHHHHHQKLHQQQQQHQQHKQHPAGEPIVNVNGQKPLPPLVPVTKPSPSPPDKVAEQVHPVPVPVVDNQDHHNHQGPEKGEPIVNVNGQEKPLSVPPVTSSDKVVEQVDPDPDSVGSDDSISPPPATENLYHYDKNETSDEVESTTESDEVESTTESEEVESTTESKIEPLLEVTEKVHTVDNHDYAHHKVPVMSIVVGQENPLPTVTPSAPESSSSSDKVVEQVDPDPVDSVSPDNSVSPPPPEAVEDFDYSDKNETSEEVESTTSNEIELEPLDVIEKVHPVGDHESHNQVPEEPIVNGQESTLQPLPPSVTESLVTESSPTSDKVVEQVDPVVRDDTVSPPPIAAENHDHFDKNETSEEVESTTFEVESTTSEPEPLEVEKIQPIADDHHNRQHLSEPIVYGQENTLPPLPTSVPESSPSPDKVIEQVDPAPVEPFGSDNSVLPPPEAAENNDYYMDKNETNEEVESTTSIGTEPLEVVENVHQVDKYENGNDEPNATGDNQSLKFDDNSAEAKSSNIDLPKEVEKEDLAAPTPLEPEIHDNTPQNIELPAEFSEKIDPTNLNIDVEESTSPIPPPEMNLPNSHEHDHNQTIEGEKSSFFFVIKYLSTSLLEFLPEHLQDTILDVDDALVFTGIIALTLVSICVPYYFIEGFMAVRPLKKKVTELNKTLWKVNAAYENQQEEFDHFKKKAFAHDDDQKRIEQLELELHILKKLETKQKDQLKTLKNELRNSAKVASEIEGLVEATMTERNKAYEEREKLKNALVSIQESYKYSSENLESLKKTFANLSMDFELEKHSGETFKFKSLTLEKEIEELKTKLLTEVDLRRKAETEFELLTDDKNLLNDKFGDLKKILGQYEETVSNISQELTAKENELEALKETLGEDSPLIDIAEQKARLANAEEEVVSLKSRVESLTIEKNSLSKEAHEIKTNLDSLKAEKEKAENRLKVLEAWFKEKEDELRTMVEKYEVEKTIRGKDKDDLINMIENQMDEIRELKHTIDKLKDEFEDQRIVHKNEIRSLEVKGHENWLSLCQAERKSQDARKEAEFLRQKLLALTKEKEGEGSEANLNLNGEFPYGISTPLLPPEMIPPPMSEEEVPSYFGLGDDFMPPPPLPLGVSERDQMRPAPLGRMSPNYSDLDDPLLSPIRRDDRNDYTPDYSSRSGSGSEGGDLDNSRNNWLNDQRERRHSHNNNNNNNNRINRRNNGPKRSSPIPNGSVNL